jgi:hypothetical protein
VEERPGESAESHALAEQLARALGSPVVPAVLRELEAAGGYLECVWPQLAPSVATQGFLGSALYMADMAADEIEESYEPGLSRASLIAGGLAPAELEELLPVLDVFHWLQPQLLLLLGALAEAWEAPVVGGQGRPEPRASGDRQRTQLATEVTLASPSTPPLPAVAEALVLAEPPELYCAVARWPRYLEPTWEELQHLAAYPPIRRRGRALYFYARSSVRFLARPLRASREELAAQGVSGVALDRAHDAIEAALPALATMMMHASAMRLGLGLRDREVVTRA